MHVKDIEAALMEYDELYQERQEYCKKEYAVFAFL